MDGRTSGRTTTTDTCSRHNPGKSQGRPKETSPRSKRIVQNGLPGCVLPESPRPGSGDRKVRTGQQPSEHDFHADDEEARPANWLPLPHSQAFKTTEFWATVGLVVAILVSAAVINGGDNGTDEFIARQAWLYVSILGAGYFISRGLAKSGSREPYAADDDDR